MERAKPAPAAGFCPRRYARKSVDFRRRKMAARVYDLSDLATAALSYAKE
jgi:hypothetical protein